MGGRGGVGRGEKRGGEGRVGGKWKGGEGRGEGRGVKGKGAVERRQGEGRGRERKGSSGLVNNNAFHSSGTLFVCVLTAEDTPTYSRHAHQ